MRILLFAGADQRYGSLKACEQLLHEVNKLSRDAEFVVVTQKNGPLNRWCNEEGIENHVVPYRYCVYYPSKNRLIKWWKRQLKRLIVTAQNYYALRIIESRGILNNISIIHTNHNRDLIGCMLSRKYGLPNIIHLRELPRAHFHLEPLYDNQIDYMNRNASSFVAISKAVQKDWIESGLDGKKVRLIYDGVDTEKFSENRDDHCRKDVFRIVMCGGIYEGKGQLDAAKAVSLVIKKGYHVSLDYYGESCNKKYYSELKSYIENNNLAGIINFRGYLNKINEVLGNYDAGLVCSKAEGFGLVTVEYLLSGLCVIASDTGANPELLGKGEYGYLYPFGDTGKLAEAILEAYYSKTQEQYSSERNAEYVRKNYSVRKMSATILDLYLNSIMEAI